MQSSVTGGVARWDEGDSFQSARVGGNVAQPRLLHGVLSFDSGGKSGVVWRLLAALMLALLWPGVMARAAVQPPRTIRVVLDNNYPPYSFQSDDGQAQGILIDQWRAWEKQTGIKVEIHTMDWADALRRMRAGDFDVIDCIVETAERRDYFDFTPAYATIEVPIFFRDVISGITDLRSLRGFPVGVKAGDQHIDKLKEAGVTNLILFQNYEAIVEAARQHKINVFVADAPSALYYLHKAGVEGGFRQSASIFRDGLQRAVREGDTDLLRALLEGFTAIGPDALKRIDEKWFGHPVSRYERYLRYAAAAVVAASLLAAGFGGWNYVLRKKIRERTVALSESEQRIRMIIDTIPTMAWSVQPDGAVDFLNQRWLDYTGLTTEQGIKTPTSAIHPEDLPGVLDTWRADMARGETFAREMRLRRADGEYRWFLIRTAPLRDGQGGIVKWFGSSVDIEDQKQAVEALLRSKQQLHALIGRLNTVREDEAKRIARELHDDLGQKLTALNMELAHLETTLAASSVNQRAQIEQMHSVVDQMIEAVQEISSELRLGQLDVLGLTAAIEWQLKEFSHRSRIPCSVTRLDEIESLSDAQNTAVFRILQEALTNIVRHAGATRVAVSLQAGTEEVVLKIRDNGRGATASELNDRKAIGLLGMRERAQSVGGTVAITSEPGVGTTVLVTIPLAWAGRIPA